MRTRRRRIVLEVQPGWAAGTQITYLHTSCTGQQNSMTGTYGNAYPDFASEEIEETISDVRERKLKNKPVWHRRRTLKLKVDPAAEQFECGTDSAFGKGSFVVSNDVSLTRPKIIAMQMRDRIYNWELDPSSPYKDDLPPNVLRTPQRKADAALIEDCFSKAQGLQADILLDIIEGGQFLPSVRQAAEGLGALVGLNEFGGLKTNMLPRGNQALCWRKFSRFLGGRARLISNAYLAWQFGLAPVIADMRKVAEAAPDIRKKIQQWRDGKTMRYSASTDYKMYLNPTKVEEQQSAAGISWPTRIIRHDLDEIEKPTIRYVLRVQPTPYLTDEILSPISRLATMFASSPASLTWELVPYSFVVDWFLDLRNLLRHLDMIVRYEPYIVKSLSRSHSFELTQRVTYTQFHACNQGVMWGPTELARCTYRHYERYPTGSGLKLPTPRSRFGKTQIAESAALILQKLNLGAK